MSEPPYTVLTGKMKEYFDKVREVSVPSKVDREWLQSVGFSSGNDYYIIGIWKYIGFLEENNNVTETWRDYKRSREPEKVLAKAIISGYKELYELYSDAYNKDASTIHAFFSSKSDKARSTIDRMVTTYNNLCELATFEGVGVDLEQVKEEQTKYIKIDEPLGDKVKFIKNVPDININIQLVLPETDDVDIYDKIFKSMKKHFFPDE